VHGHGAQVRHGMPPTTLPIATRLTPEQRAGYPLDQGMGQAEADVRRAPP
jgi:hypothetical protein